MEAVKNNKEFIEVNSKALHALVSPQHATMPTCCQAIYKLMLQGDEILQRPKGNTGFGSHLTVRFYLHDMDTRERMFPIKKEVDQLNLKRKNWRQRKAKNEAQYRRFM